MIPVLVQLWRIEPGAGSTFGLLLPVGEVPATRDADELELFEEIDDDREPAEAHR